MVAGTNSKCVGKGSSPNLRASSHAQSIESRTRSISLSAIRGSFVENSHEQLQGDESRPTLSGRDRVAQGKELAQRGINLFLIRNGHGSKFLISNLVVSSHQSTGGAIMPFT